MVLVRAPNFGTESLFWNLFHVGTNYKFYCHCLFAFNLGDVTFFRLQDILINTVPGVFEDLKFKISEGLDQN